MRKRRQLLKDQKRTVSQTRISQARSWRQPISGTSVIESIACQNGDVMKHQIHHTSFWLSLRVPNKNCNALHSKPARVLRIQLWVLVNLRRASVSTGRSHTYTRPTQAQPGTSKSIPILQHNLHSSLHCTHELWSTQPSILKAPSSKGTTYSVQVHVDSFHPRSAAGSSNNNRRSWHWTGEHFIHCWPYLFLLYYIACQSRVWRLFIQKESKISSSSLHSAPSVLIVVDPVNIAVTVFSDVCHPRPYTTNKKDACKHHASKCADHLRTRNMNRLYWNEGMKSAASINARMQGLLLNAPQKNHILMMQPLKIWRCSLSWQTNLTMDLSSCLVPTIKLNLERYR